MRQVEGYEIIFQEARNRAQWAALFSQFQVRPRPLGMTEPSKDTLRAAAEHYRQKAFECRTKADRTNDQWARHSFLEAAEFWMRLGVQAARRVAATNE